MNHLVELADVEACAVSSTVEITLPIQLVGLNHRSALAEVRSKVAITSDQTETFVLGLRAMGAREAAVLSTCNRTEIYFTGISSEDVIERLAEHAGLTAGELRQSLYVKSAACAACHLFRVASGLDSAVLGETEIVAQVKDARRLSEALGMSGSAVDLLFTRALETSKRVRTETNLCRVVTSTASLAARHIGQALNGAEAQIAVLGAGKIAERVLKELRGLAHLIVLNRSEDRGRAMAAEYGTDFLPLSDLSSVLSRVDAVVCCLSVEEPVIVDEMLRAAGRRLCLVDMGVPPNVGPTEAAHVVTVDDLAKLSLDNQQERLASVPDALQILDFELHRYNQTLVEKSAAPVIQALMSHGERIKQQNLDWAKDRLGHLNEKEIRVVEELARRMVLGLLREPIEGLKREFHSPEERQSVERLFGLGGERNS